MIGASGEVHWWTQGDKATACGLLTFGETEPPDTAAVTCPTCLRSESYRDGVVAKVVGAARAKPVPVVGTRDHMGVWTLTVGAETVLEKRLSTRIVRLYLRVVTHTLDAVGQAWKVRTNPRL